MANKTSEIFCVGINKATMAWVGPEDVEEAFEARFYRSCQLSGDVFLCGGEEDTFNMYSEMARKQGNFVSPAVLKDLPKDELLQTILAPGQLRIVGEYEDLKQDRCGLDGSFLADIDHHPDTAATCGPYWPCQLTHGTVMSWSGHEGSELPRIATGLEHLGTQGFHLFEATTEDFMMTARAKAFKKLKPAEQKHLSGNGMHLAILLQWLYFILGNVIRRDRPMQILRLASSEHLEDASDEEDVE